MSQLTQPKDELGSDNPKQVRRSLTQLREDYNKYRVHLGKPFVHTKSGENYQVLQITWDEETNTPHFTYCYSAMTWLKFSRPCDQFLLKFHERGAV